MNESTGQGAAPARPGAARLLSDSRLARRAAQGDQSAFAAIFQRYHQDLYRYCVAILRNSQDAQDALQNTMVKALAALPGEAREIQLKPWLYRIAHNEAIDLRRSRRPLESLDAEVPTLEAEPAEAADLRARMQSLLSDIGELPERQRGALVMRELSGLSFEQIGATFATSPAVARQTVYEARLSLQRMSAGHEMDCAAVTRALSDGDGRLSRRRELRAHLRSCSECRRFKQRLEQRQRDFAVIAPLPAAVATGLLHGLLGGGTSSASGGVLAGLGAATGKTVAGSAIVKSAATVAVVAVVGATAADRAGLVHLGVPGSGSDHGSSTRQAEPAGEQGETPQSLSAGLSQAAAAGQGGPTTHDSGVAKGRKGARGEQAADKGKESAPGQVTRHSGGSRGHAPPDPQPNHGQGAGKSQGAGSGSRSQGKGAFSGSQGSGGVSNGQGAGKPTTPQHSSSAKSGPAKAHPASPAKSSPSAKPPRPPPTEKGLP